MKTEPTYTATEVKKMCANFAFDYITFNVLVNLIDDEFDLYEAEDLPILMDAAMIIFIRSIINKIR